MRAHVSVLLVSTGCGLFPSVDGLTRDASLDAVPDVISDVASDADGGDAGYFFIDDFNRADSSTVGNGWLTKQPAFVIASGTAMRQYSSGYDYRDLLVYRPASEAVANVEASFELQYSQSAVGYPQIHVRIQPATAAVADTLDDYLLFPSSGGGSDMTIARNRNTSNFQTLATFALSPPLDATHRFRFVLRATGTSPVALAGEVDRLDTSTWTPIGTGTATDNAAFALGGGVVGFSAGSGDTTGQYSYDNFTARSL